MLERRWRFAVKTLMEGLVGLPYELAYNVLKGDGRFTGVNTLNYEEDDAVAYKKELDYHYGRTFTFLDQFWEPYAEVQGVSMSTFKWNQSRRYVDGQDQHIMFSKKTVIEFANFTGLGYANDPANDILIAVDLVERTHGSSMRRSNARLFLCRQTHDFPGFLKATPHPEVAILRALPLEKRGWRSTTNLLMSTDWMEGDPENRDIPESFKRRPTLAEVEHQCADSDNADYYAFGGGNDMLMGYEQEPNRFARAEAIINEKFSSLDKAIEEYRNSDKGAATEKFVRNIYRKKIVEQAEANGGFFELGVIDGEKVMVPKNPFYRWVLRDFPSKKAAYPWENVSPRGVKMFADNPDHTDWVLGSGRELEEAYEGPLYDLAWERYFDIQEELVTHEEKMDALAKGVPGCL